MKFKRICIYPKDIVLLTGKSDRAARNEIRQLKIELGKKPWQYVTIKEYSEFSGLKEDEIYMRLPD